MNLPKLLSCRHFFFYILNDVKCIKLFLSEDFAFANLPLTQEFNFIVKWKAYKYALCYFKKCFYTNSHFFNIII